MVKNQSFLEKCDGVNGESVRWSIAVSAELLGWVDSAAAYYTVTNIATFMRRKKLSKILSHWWAIQVWSVGPMWAACKWSDMSICVSILSSLSLGLTYPVASQSNWMLSGRYRWGSSNSSNTGSETENIRDNNSLSTPFLICPIQIFLKGEIKGNNWSSNTVVTIVVFPQFLQFSLNSWTCLKQILFFNVVILFFCEKRLIITIP